jgi:hypothetical protein
MHTYKVQEGVMAQGSCLSEQLPLRALWQVRLVLHKGAYQAASSFRLRLQKSVCLGGRATTLQNLSHLEERSYDKKRQI